jgi:predicted nucleotidyltransferase
MRKAQQRILQEFAKEVRIKYPGALIWAFGSYARGTATDESDLDVCVVVPEMQHRDRLVISDLAWEIGLVHDLYLSTVVFSERDFKTGAISASPLLATIRDEGVAA